MLVVQSLKNQNPIQSEPQADPDAFIGLWMCVQMLDRKYLCRWEVLYKAI